MRTRTSIAKLSPKARALKGRQWGWWVSRWGPRAGSVLGRGYAHTRVGARYAAWRLLRLERAEVRFWAKSRRGEPL